MDIFSKDFDPNKLTKPQLRSVLGDNGITDLPPTNAKKEELVTLLLERVIKPTVEQQKKTSSKKSSRSVKASSHGITFLDGSGKEGSPVPPKSFKDETKGKKIGEKVQKPKKSASSSKKSSTETLISDDSNFSDENPFQTPAKYVERVKSSSALKRNDSPSISMEKSPVVKRPITPLPFPEKIVFEPFVEKEDKFLLYCNRISLVTKFIIRFSVFSFILGYIYFYFINPFPFCSTGQSKASLKFDSFRSFYSSFSNYCIECPKHGTCTNGTLKCDDKYIEKKGLWFSSSCIIDKNKISTLEDMINTAKKILNARLGCYNCKLENSPFFTGSQLKKLLFDYKKPDSFRAWNETSEKFDEFWKLFAEEIKQNASFHGISYKDGKLQGTDPIMPLKCRIITMVKTFISKNQKFIFLLSVIFLLVGMFRRFLANKNRVARIADEIIEKVFNRLMEQDFSSRRNSSVQSTLSINQLRDSLLIGVNLDPKSKKYIWEIVYKIVSNNSNVREYVSTIRGEQHKVWEWVGNAASEVRKEMRELK